MASVRRNEPIRGWASGDTVQGFALVTRKELREDRNGRSFIDLKVADASGSMVAKVWADSPALTAEFEAHDFVALRGSVKLYREQLQLSIDDCRRATDADRRYGFDESLLVPSTREDVDDLQRRLRAAMAEIRRPELARLAEHALEVYGARLREHPAAKSIHHAYRGGLLEHVVSMAELAVKVCAHYPKLDRDLVLLGVLFHDLGKIRELGAMPANDYTLEGRMIGHVVIGRDLLRECCLALGDVPDDLQLHLEHLVLSHQGKREFASPVEPMTPEAVVLHFIDDLDSKLNQLEAVRADGGGLQWIRALGRYVLVDDLETPAPDDGGPERPAAERDEPKAEGDAPEAADDAPEAERDEPEAEGDAPTAEDEEPPAEQTATDRETAADEGPPTTVVEVERTVARVATADASSEDSADPGPPSPAEIAVGRTLFD